MTETQILIHLENKVYQFLDLLPPKLSKLVYEQMYFGGGCIYSLANDKKPKDYDIFLTSDELIEELKSLDFWRCKTDNALSYGEFQVIIKFYGEPEEVIGQFDFKHNMHWYKPSSDSHINCGYEEELENNTSSLDDYIYIHTNELIFNEKRARDCDNVWLRIDKFIKRGMTISKETKKKIMTKTSKKEIRTARKRHRSGRSGSSGRSGGFY